jgi:hypothetical protein
MSARLYRLIFGSLCLAGCWLGDAPGAGAVEPPSPALYALIVAGGPDKESNAAQIEGHARFVGQILPAAATRSLLFADGRRDSATVSALDLSAVPEARRALAVLLPENGLDPAPTHRKPEPGMKIDGPSRLRELDRAFIRLTGQAAANPAPVLLYFAGHGTQNEDTPAATSYDMWDSDELNVRALAAEVARLPARVPVVLVMAQCFSGAFANVLFHRGEPDGAPTGRDLAGFFSAHEDRTASGCSPETTAADYQDFSSYFFGALSGHDRFGHAIETADFDNDGRVSLHEAFCYALIHDASSDTPICTSEVFLRRFAALPAAEIYGQPYGKIRQAATAAQRAALDALSLQLGLTGEQRPLAAYDRLKFSDPIAPPALAKAETDAAQTLNSLRLTTLAKLFARWPALRWSDARDYAQAVNGAAAEIGSDQELVGALLAADKSDQQAQDAADNDEAALLRFTDVCESVVEARELRLHGPAEVKSQFERLWQAEQRSLPLRAR